MKKLYIRVIILTLPVLFLFQNCVKAPGVDTSASNGSTDGLFSDSANDAILDEYAPTYSLTWVNHVTQNSGSHLPMYMNHSTTQVSAPFLAQCSNCHTGASQTPPVYTGGVFHATLINLSMSQPALCNDCHQSGGSVSSLASGFIGPVQALRNPQSPSMKHNAVVWSAGADQLGTASSTATGIVTYDCSTCHVAPTSGSTGWNLPNPAAGAGTTAYFHASLNAASIAQPTSCVDCHGNSQPWGTTSYNGDTVPDHSQLPMAGSACGACHTYPGSGTATSPNWKNASLGYPTNVTLNPPTSSMWASSATQSVPHPTNLNGSAITETTSCTTCHGNFGPNNSVAGWDHQTLNVNGTPACGWCHFPQNSVAAGTSETFDGDNAHPSVDAFTDCTTCHSVGNPTRPTFAFPTFNGSAFTGGVW